MGVSISSPRELAIVKRIDELEQDLITVSNLMSKVKHYKVEKAYNNLQYLLEYNIDQLYSQLNEN